MNVSKLGEFGLIDLIAKSVPRDRSVIKGIGDDAAVLPYSKNKHLLFTTDMLAEGVHFNRKMGAKVIGHKAIACNISDIAAMGGLPTYAVISIGLPSTLPVRFVQDLYKGMSDTAKEFGVSIVGGDTIKSDKVTINVALLGEVKKKNLILRSGAKSKDWVFVSGQLGGSFKSGKHLTFTPRVKFAQFLVKNFKPTSMMDISDGLAGDLNHILSASKVGVKLWEDAIPKNSGTTLAQALSDGEDYELLFTVPERKALKLIDWQFKYKKFNFYPIGEITKNAKQRINVKSFTHF